MNPVLRFFAGDDAAPADPPAVTLPFGELVAALKSAGSAAWLDDFAGDEVRVSPDLYEVVRLLRERDHAA